MTFITLVLKYNLAVIETSIRAKNIRSIYYIKTVQGSADGYFFIMMFKFNVNNVPELDFNPEQKYQLSESEEAAADNIQSP